MRATDARNGTSVAAATDLGYIKLKAIKEKHMLVHCPACQARYNVPETAIGPNGRALQCAKCGHKWKVMPPAPAAPSGTGGSVVTPAPEFPSSVDSATTAAVALAPESPAQSVPDTSPAEGANANAAVPITPSLASLSRARRAPRWLRATDPIMLATGLIILLALAAGAAFMLWPHLHDTQLESEHTETTPALPPIPAQPEGLRLSELTHQLKQRAADTSEASPTVQLIIRGMATNTTGTPLALPELRVQLLNAAAQEIDNWPATYTQTTLEPGQVTAWQATIPGLAFRNITGYRAYFVAPSLASPTAPLDDPQTQF